MSERIRVGTIGGSYGVRGEVRLKSFCAEPADIETYDPLTTEDGKTPFSIELTGRIKGGFSARVLGVLSKEEADALRGTALYAAREQLGDLPEDEFYYADLIGLTVVDTGGEVLGTVKSVANHGSDDILEVLRPGSSDTALLPFTKAAVPTVDLAAGRIVADPPGGVF